MEKFKSAAHSLDRFQRSYTILAFPVAVIKRYNDDEVGKQAALVTYYAFLSLFPLLLLFMTIIGIVIVNDPSLESRIIHQAFQLFPSLGNDLRKNVTSMHGSGLAVVLQIFVILYGARGLASILQETFNNLWHIDKKHRPGFWGDHARGFGMMLAVGLGMIIGTATSYGLHIVLHLGILSSILVTIFNILLTYGLFLVVFRLGTSARISLQKLSVGAAFATAGTMLVQQFGGYLMSHQLHKLEGSYGSFALALAMLFWIYLQAQIILYALVITVVRTERDWPKKLID